MRKSLFILVLCAVIFMGACPLNAQSEGLYYPKGNPDRWNVELTPFVWLPVISGQVGSKRLSEDFEVPVVDLLGNLEMAFMLTADISKGKFFMSPTYVYTKLGTENVLWSSDDGTHNLVIEPNLKMNIFEFIAGPRFQINSEFNIDPFVGFRYSNYKVYGSLQAHSNHSFEDVSDFWDPVIGLQLSYFPHPRVPIIFKSDIGGFGAGSEFSWAVSVNSGYTISPSIDLLAGFAANGSDFEKEINPSNTVGLDMRMYGINLGMTYHIPKRKEDNDIFKSKYKH